MAGPNEVREEVEFDPMQAMQDFISAGLGEAIERYGENTGRTLYRYLCGGRIPYGPRKPAPTKCEFRNIAEKRRKYLAYLRRITHEYGQTDLVDGCLVHDLRAYKAGSSEGIVKFKDGEVSCGEPELMYGALSVSVILDNPEGRIAKELEDVPISNMLRGIRGVVRNLFSGLPLVTIANLARERHGEDSEELSLALRELAHYFCYSDLHALAGMIRPEWMPVIMENIMAMPGDGGRSHLYKNLDYYLAYSDEQLAERKAARYYYGCDPFEVVSTLRSFPDLMQFYENRKRELEEQARAAEEAEKVELERAETARKVEEERRRAESERANAEHIATVGPLLEAAASALETLTVSFDGVDFNNQDLPSTGSYVIETPECFRSLNSSPRVNSGVTLEGERSSINAINYFIEALVSHCYSHGELIESARRISSAWKEAVKPRLLDELDVAIFENKERLWKNSSDNRNLSPECPDLDSFYDESYHGAIKGQKRGKRDQKTIDEYFDEIIIKIERTLEESEQEDAWSLRGRLENPEYAKSKTFFLSKLESRKRELREAIQKSKDQRAEIKKEKALHRARGVYMGELKKIAKSKAGAEQKGGYSETLEIKHILRTAEAQTEYLVNLFSAVTGLRFSAGATAKAEDKGSIGYVRIVEIGDQNITVELLGMRLVMRLKLQQTLELKVRPENHIHLELGDDIDSMRMRIPMADFLAAHEASHIVDMCLAVRENGKRPHDAPKLKCSGDLITHKYAHEATVAAKGMPFDTDECLNHFGHVMGESFIDGMAVRLLRDCGTTKLDDDTMSKRLNTTFSSMAATLKVIDIVTQRNLADGTYMLPYFFHVVRHIASAKQLLAAAEIHGIDIDSSKLKELEIIVENLELLQEEVVMNLAKTDGRFDPNMMITPESIQEISAVCAAMYNEAEEMEFPVNRKSE